MSSELKVYESYKVREFTSVFNLSGIIRDIHDQNTADSGHILPFFSHGFVGKNGGRKSTFRQVLHTTDIEQLEICVDDLVHLCTECSLDSVIQMSDIRPPCPSYWLFYH